VSQMFRLPMNSSAASTGKVGSRDEAYRISQKLQRRRRMSPAKSEILPKSHIGLYSLGLKRL